jgi:hypothetical protein
LGGVVTDMFRFHHQDVPFFIVVVSLG